MRRFASLSLFTLACAFSAASTHGATFTVNSTADVTDALPGDGVCETAAGNGICTLRGAIQEANALPGADTIILPAGTYTLTLPTTTRRPTFGVHDYDGDLNIEGDLTISGAGAASTIIQGGPTLATAVDGVFWIGLGRSNPTVTISGVTIANGSGLTGEGCLGGGGIASYYGSNVALHDVVVTGNQGGICNYGTMTIDRTSIVNNAAPLGGGGLVVLGKATIENSTISGNQAVLYPGLESYGAFGGGVVIFSQGELAMSNSTVSANSAISGGGGVYVINDYSIPPKVSLNNVTIGGNSAPAGGGMTECIPTADINCSFAHPTGSAGTIKNSIIAGNSGGNCGDIALYPFTAPSSLGHNVEDANDCGFAGTGDRVNANASLGPLAFNGGPTETHALLAGSAAIDAGDPAGCTDDLGAVLASDQRGLARTVNGVCDAGAYEVQQTLGGTSAVISSATGAGSITFSAGAGTFGSLDAIAASDIPTPPPNGVSFPFGLFSWTLTGLTAGQTVTLTLTYPTPIASPASYWKISNGTWTDATSLLGSDDGDNILTLTVTDGGAGDSDGIANGQISDPGGLGIGAFFSSFTASVDIERKELGVSASFQLAPSSNGIDPANEPVALHVGPFALTIPPHSFRATGKGGFAFQGTVNGTRLESTIRPSGTRHFDFQAQVHGVDLSNLSSPAAVKLAIGDDSGAVSVVPRISP